MARTCTLSAPFDIRLVVCDIDGTLVRHDKSLPEVNVAAAWRLRAGGVAISLISARPMSGVRLLAEALGIDGPVGAFNGGTVFGPPGVIGRTQRLPPATARRLLSILDDAKVDVWLFADERWYGRDALNCHVPRERLSAAVEPTLRGDLEALCDAADKIVGVSDDAPLLEALEAELRCATQGEATVALSQPYFLDATALLANKGDGVAAIALAFGVPLEQVAVIGDMPNDLPMFARAGLSIAMGQAPGLVRDAADWTTASNEEGGVAQAIGRLLGDKA